MSINILDLDDAMLEGNAKLQEMMDEIQKDFFQPLLDTEISEMWQGIPDDMKMLLKQVNPEEVKRVEKRFGGK